MLPYDLKVVSQGCDRRAAVVFAPRLQDDELQPHELQPGWTLMNASASRLLHASQEIQCVI